MAIAAAEPSSATLMNVAIAMRHLRRFAEARDWVIDHRAQIEPIELAGFLSAMAHHLGDETEAVRWGEESLRLRDAEALPSDAFEPVVRPFSAERPRRNVLSFSLWGEGRRYIAGAIANAEAARLVYPGWTARFYVDHSVPPGTIARLQGLGAEVLRVEGLPAERYGMFWRMLVEDDPEVDLYLIRDADALVNPKERWAVGDWLAAGTAFHVMRDHPAHCEVMLGGMWGAHRGNLGSMTERVLAFVRSYGNRLKRSYDQEFLRREIWPIVRQSVTQHDRCFHLRQPRRFDPSVALPPGMHIGQNLFGA